MNGMPSYSTSLRTQKLGTWFRARGDCERFAGAMQDAASAAESG